MIKIREENIIIKKDVFNEKGYKELKVILGK